MMFSIIVFPYRDLYFAKKFGWAVRDLAIINALANSKRVSSLHVVQRPVSIYERLLGIKIKKNRAKNDVLKVFDFTSIDFIGPFAGRSWTRNIYNNYLSDILARCDNDNKQCIKSINTVLDFTPIAKISYKAFPNHLVWYDLIDNFCKHNRFNNKERRLVNDKYTIVNQEADLITAVTDLALINFDSSKSMAISNGLNSSRPPLDINAKYDLGYIGFITDKFDVDLIKHLAINGNFRIAIYGKVYDNSIGRKLKDIHNVTLKGQFHDMDLGNILSTFKIGLIPYIKEKLHDESPIKLYQYILHGKQVISTTHFFRDSEQFGKYVYITNDNAYADLISDIQAMLIAATSGGLSFSKSISNMIKPELLWSHKVDTVLNRLEQIASKRALQGFT